MSDYDSLKALHRSVRDGLPKALNLRVHRALSWLQRADQCEDGDGRFIFLWIAFNAAYAQEISRNLDTKQSFADFLHKLHALDTAKQLDGLVWREFSGPIRVLLDTPFVFEDFWAFHRSEISEAEWKKRLASGKAAANKLLANGDTPALLGLVLRRIYTVRNQLMHGGATWSSSLNRAQLNDCVNFLGKLVPAVIAIMLSSPTTIWGEACYPVVDA